jgi:hypothetical protein
MRCRTGLGLFIALCIGSDIAAMADDGLETQVAGVLATLDEADTYAACQRIEQADSPQTIGRLYHAVAQALYHRRRDPRGMTAVARAGIHWALTDAQCIETSDPAEAASLRSQAKTIAYDLSSNLWPGWQDEGIVLTPADLATGLEAARLNLRLATELDKTPDRL